MEAIERPFDAAAAELGMPVEDLLEHLQGMVDRKLLRRVAALLITAAPASRRTGWACGRCPRRRSSRRAGAWPPSAAFRTATSAPPTRTGPTASSRWPTAARRRSATRSSTRSPPSAASGPRTARPSTLDRVQEDPSPVLHRRLLALGARARDLTPAAPDLGQTRDGRRLSRHEGLRPAPRAGAEGAARRGELAGPRDAPDRPRADLRRARRGLRADRRRRQPLRRLDRFLGAADPRAMPRRP